MTDAPSPAPSSAPAQSTQKAKASSKPTEDFGAIYLRKIAAELADDLDKVREAQDFKANSVPMLIHALKQGESLFSAEEKRRFIGAASQ
jgi:ribosome assembly protein 3